jgi:hypothetical protein
MQFLHKEIGCLQEEKIKREPLMEAVLCVFMWPCYGKLLTRKRVPVTNRLDALPGMTIDAYNTLVYFVGGLNDLSKKGRNGIEIMAEAVKARMPADTCCEVHQYSQATLIHRHSTRRGSSIPVFTRLSAEDHAKDLSRTLQEIVNKINPGRIILIGYSSGTAVLRNAIAEDISTDSSNRQSQAANKWTSLIKRIIHIGGMTTGWEFNSEVPKAYLWIGPKIRPLCPFWFPWQIYKGSKFITETRIAMNRDCRQRTRQFKEDYLVGTRDEYITPADAIELGGAIDYNNPKYIEVAGCTHTSILRNKRKQANTAVRDYIVQSIASEAIVSPGLPDGLRIINPDDIDDYLDPLDNEPVRRDLDVGHVIIVMHGIRDNGMWAKRIGNIIKDTWRKRSQDTKTRTVRVVSPSYGYFSLWDFVRPGGRRRAVEWFQNIYANVCALYPSAKISFIGHSNGTYLGAHALQCKNLEYKYMILAGSVLRQKFWIEKKTGQQWKLRVSRLFSFRSIDDWIVALLPGGMEMIPLLGRSMNLGGAGAYGFAGLKEGEEQRTIRGGHGAAIEADTWEQLAQFLLDINDEKQTPFIPGVNGHLAPSTPKKAPAQWTINRLLNFTKVFRLAGGLLIVGVIISCFLPLIVPILAVLGLISLQNPMTTMLALVIASAIAFSILKNI